MNAYTMTDSPGREQCLHISWTRLLIPDEHADAPDDSDDGFWPSQDPDAAGYIGPNPERSFEEQQEAAEARMEAWRAGDWGFVGIVARAVVHIPQGGQSFRVLTLDSAGLWGVESDAGEAYLAEVYAEQKADLMAELKTLAAGLDQAEQEEAD